MIAHGEEQIVVPRLHDAAAEMIAARERAVLPEDHLTSASAAPRRAARARARCVPPPSAGSA